MKSLRNITLPATLAGALALAACGAEEQKETVKAPVAEKTYDLENMSDAEKDAVMKEFKDTVGSYAMVCTGRVNKENPLPEKTGNELLYKFLLKIYFLNKYLYGLTPTSGTG